MCAVGRTDTDTQLHAIRVHGGCGQRLHPAKRRPDAGVDLLNAQVVQQQKLRAHHILHRHKREGRGIDLIRERVDGGRTRAAVAATEVVAADDKVLVCVNCFPWANKLLPPARCFVSLGGGGQERGGKVEIERLREEGG